jgi:hypothetical protein
MDERKKYPKTLSKTKIFQELDAYQTMNQLQLNKLLLKYEYIKDDGEKQAIIY